MHRDPTCSYRRAVAVADDELRKATTRARASFSRSAARSERRSWRQDHEADTARVKDEIESLRLRVLEASPSKSSPPSTPGRVGERGGDIGLSGWPMVPEFEQPQSPRA